jgi:hypothetical protein
VATLLSATGCVDPRNASAPAAGLIPYAVAAPLWSDGADKERWLALPNGTTIQVQADGDFSLPPGRVLMKHFRLAGDLVETRLFMRHANGGNDCLTERPGYPRRFAAASLKRELPL